MDHQDDVVIDMHAWARRKRPRTDDQERPTRTQARAQAARRDYRLRTGVLRGQPSPPTEDYRTARAALENLRTRRRGTPS